MKYSVVAVLAAAASVSSWSNDTIVYTTEIVDTYTTVCPASSAITYNGVTYTNTLTESSTITITNCPCTISKPVYTTSSVAAPSSAPYTNATTPIIIGSATAPAGGSVGTTAPPAGTPTPPTVPASGANKVFAVSGASLAGLLGLAAYLL